METKLHTVDGYGRVYGPRRTKTYELIKSGDLETVMIGRRRYITTASADAHIERNIAKRSSEAGK